MKPKGNKPKRSRMKLFILGLIVLSVGLAAWGGYTFYKNTSLNYAEEVARPLEEALVKAGGVKRCESGDGGRGWDNRSPWYTVYFELAADNAKTKDLISGIAKNNGFSLTQTAQGTKGYLGDTVYIGSKTSTNKALQSGLTEVALALTNSGTLHACPPIEVTNGPDHTAIVLEVKLPSLK